MFSSF
jgi:hypothetical protein